MPIEVARVRMTWGSVHRLLVPVRRLFTMHIVMLHVVALSYKAAFISADYMLGHAGCHRSASRCQTDNAAAKMVVACTINAASRPAMQNQGCECIEQEGNKGLTVQCALEGNCVLLRRDTLLSEALDLLDEEEQSVALVVRLPDADIEWQPCWAVA